MKKRIFRAILPLLYCLYFFIRTFSIGGCGPLFPAALDNASFFHASAPITATASGSYTYSSYAYVQADAYFYSVPDERRGLFLLPETYYVKILDYQSDFCKIEYLYDDTLTKKIIGYARTDRLIPVDYVPKRPYLYYVFDVRYYIDEQLNDSSFLNQITVTCAYYGDYRIGSETYCYVLRGDTFGYVPKPAELSFEENTEYADYLAAQESTSEGDTSASNGDSPSSPAQIGILVALCLLVPVLAALILKPSRRPPYDDDT